MPNATSVAVFGIDPGGTTGCATALIDLRQITVAKAMKRARIKGNIDTWCEKGHYVDQAWAIARRITDFLFTVHIEKSLIENEKFFIVCENFEIRQMGADLSPVEVRSGFETLLKGVFKDLWEKEGFYSLQTASEAKGFCNNDMLDRWGLLRGRTPHERDALRHIARRIDKLL
jgi:hypothetical protein